MQPDHRDKGGATPTSPLQLNKKDWWVADVDLSTAREIVEREHYAKGASKSATYLHGLFPRHYHWHSECIGVAWWIPPIKNAAKAWAGDGWDGVLALSRLAIEPNAPKNAATYLIMNSVRLIDRSRWHTLVSYADGWRGHSGKIYYAAGWEYCGETEPIAAYTIGGRLRSIKSGDNTRTHAEMIALGARFEGKFKKHRFCLKPFPGNGEAKTGGVPVDKTEGRI